MEHLGPSFAQVPSSVGDTSASRVVAFARLVRARFGADSDGTVSASPRFVRVGAGFGRFTLGFLAAAAFVPRASPTIGASAIACVVADFDADLVVGAISPKMCQGAE
jgi:hypothetical protein